MERRRSPDASVERHFDSRFMAIRFRKAATLTSTDLIVAEDPLPFYVIGSDNGEVGSSAILADIISSELGSCYDIVFDFA